MDTETARIRALNDELRLKLTEGTVVMTQGVAALGREAVARIVETISVFDDFCNANDPYEEHDFGAFEADGHTISLQAGISLGTFLSCSVRLLVSMPWHFRQQSH